MPVNPAIMSVVLVTTILIQVKTNPIAKIPTVTAIATVIAMPH